MRHVRTLAVAVVLVTLAPASPASAAQDGGVVTVAKSGDGDAPQSPTFDSAGNLFFAERRAHVVRMLTPGRDGVVDGGRHAGTVAGDGTLGYSGDGGPATRAQLANPADVAVDGAGNLYIADAYNYRVRKVSPGEDGVVNGGRDEIITTVAGSGQCLSTCTAVEVGDGGPAILAKFSFPTGVDVDGAGNIYIADTGNHHARKVDAVTGIISTVAGNGTRASGGDGGPATSAQLSAPVGVTLKGSKLFISEQGGGRVRLVNLGPTPVTAHNLTVDPGSIATVAGNGTGGYSGDDGPATAASIAAPFATAVDGSGNLFISDEGNDRARKVDIAGIITTVVGPPDIDGPRGVGTFGTGLYVADTSHDRIVLIQL